MSAPRRSVESSTAKIQTRGCGPETYRDTRDKAACLAAAPSTLKQTDCDAAFVWLRAGRPRDRGETHLVMQLVHATVVVATGAERRQACGYAAERERGSLQQSLFAPRRGPRALKRAVRTWTAQPAEAAREA